MTTTNSMRFSPDELLSGMLATMEATDFTADDARLRASFGKIAAEFPLMAPFAQSDDAIQKAITALEGRGALVLDGDHYKLTDEGRAHCVSSKRTLFNKDAREQLEGAAAIFASA